MLGSRAITKIQSIVLAIVIVVASISGVAAYYFWSQTSTSGETIKIGVFLDLDTFERLAYQGILLAAEQVNAEGGILGRQVEVIGEDNDRLSGADAATAMNALNRLLDVHQVDFIIGSTFGFETMAEHRKVFMSIYTSDEIEDLVLDDYDKYKYLFVNNFNTTAVTQGIIDSLQTLRENTDFRKVAYLSGGSFARRKVWDVLDAALPDLYGYEIVYRDEYSSDTLDFSSYFAKAEAAGAEIMIPWISGSEGIQIVKEYYDRQSPMIFYGGLSGPAYVPEAWEWTEGKCEHWCVTTLPICVGYPFTSKTLPAREAYIDRWEVTPGIIDAVGYDIMRFILPDAIERAGTMEADAVVEALEQTDVETAGARHFAYSSSHGMMLGGNPRDPDVKGAIAMVFQWQNGTMVPVYPGWLMEEAGVTLAYPDWDGPWNK